MAGGWQDDGMMMVGRWQQAKQPKIMQKCLPDIRERARAHESEAFGARSEVFGAGNLAKGPSKILNGDG